MAALQNRCTVSPRCCSDSRSFLVGGCFVGGMQCSLAGVRLPASGTALKNCFVRWLLVSHGYLGYNKDSLLCPRLLMSSPSNTRHPSRSCPLDPSWRNRAGGSEYSQLSFLLGGPCMAMHLCCLHRVPESLSSCKTNCFSLERSDWGTEMPATRGKGGNWLLLTAILLVPLDFKEESKTKLVF